MDNLIPASKIGALKAGEVVAQISREADRNRKTTLSTYNRKIHIDSKKIMKEEHWYLELPKYYTFGSDKEREETLRNNPFKIDREVAEVVTFFIE